MRAPTASHIGHRRDCVGVAGEEKPCSRYPARRYDDTPAGNAHRGPDPRCRELGCIPATRTLSDQLRQPERVYRAAFPCCLTGTVSRHALGGALAASTNEPRLAVTTFTSAHEQPND